MSVNVRTTRHLRAQNCRNILEAIHAEGRLSAARLAERCSLRPSTVSNIVKQLREAGAIHECGYGESTQHGGKRPLLLELASDYGVLVGVELTPSHLRIVARDFALGMVHRAGTRLPDTLAGAQACIDDELEKLRVATAEGRVAGIAIGFDALPLGIRTNGAGSPDALLEHLEQGVEARFGAPLVVEEHAGLGACGEWLLGEDRRSRDVVFVDVGPAELAESRKIDVGLVLDGRLYRGKGHAGHLTADRPRKVDEVLDTLAGLLDPGVIAVRSDDPSSVADAGDLPVRTARFGEFAVAEGGVALAFDHAIDEIG